MSFPERDLVRWITFAAAALVPVWFIGACDAVLPRRGAAAADTTPTAAASAAPAVARQPKAASTASAIDERAAFADVRDWLRRLVVTEETYFAENGTYTLAPDVIRNRSPADVTTTMLWATRDGWAARAKHAGIAGKDCVVYVGRSRPAPATARLHRQAGEGVPVCDEPRGSSPPVAPVRARQSPSRPASSPGAAAPVAAAPSLPDTGSGLDAVSPIVQMKVDLRNLARSQDAWFGTQGAYSWRLEPFAMQYLWHRGVKLKILSADRVSWSAKATHDALPGRSCIIWFGPVGNAPRTDGQGREAARAAVPMCDESS